MHESMCECQCAQCCPIVTKMEVEQFERQKKYAANNIHILSPKGSELQTQLLKDAREHTEEMRVFVTLLENKEPCQYECVVRGVKDSWIMEVAMEADYGFYETLCSCGVVEMDAVPCVHVMAVGKSKQIPVLMLTNVMPCCWSSEIWRKPFPSNAVSRCNVDMDFLKQKYQQNKKLYYMPDFVVKKKRGRPKANTHFKSALEMAMAKK